MNNPINEMMDTSMEKIRQMADANTVVGQPIVTGDGTTVIPISRVKFAFAGGGSEFNTKNATGSAKPYGGGTGATVTVTPVAFLICKDGSCRLLSVPEPASNSLERAIEQFPDIADKVMQLIQEKKAEKAAKDSETV